MSTAASVAPGHESKRKLDGPLSSGEVGSDTPALKRVASTDAAVVLPTDESGGDGGNGTAVESKPDVPASSSLPPSFGGFGAVKFTSFTSTPSTSSSGFPPSTAPFSAGVSWGSTASIAAAPLSFGSATDFKAVFAAASAAKPSAPAPAPSTTEARTPFQSAPPAQEKPSPLDAAHSDDSDDSQGEDEDDGGGCGTDVAPLSPEPAPLVLLPGEPVSNGEEGDITLFQVRAKLFRLDGVGEDKRWRECGVGPLRVNVSQDLGKLSMSSDGSGSAGAGVTPARARLILRHECHTGGSGTRLILNLPLYAAMPVSRHAHLENAVQLCGIPADGSVAALAPSQQQQFMIKVGKPEQAKQLLDAIQKAKDSLLSVPASGTMG